MSTLAVNADGTLPYTRDATGKPVIQQPIIDAIVNAGGTAILTEQFGPFRIAFTDTGWTDTGVTLGALPQGSVVIDAWAEVITKFGFPDNEPGDLKLGIQNGPLLDYDTTAILTYAGIQSHNGPYASNWNVELSIAGGGRWKKARIIGNDISLWADLSLSPTQGSADIYAIVASPAT